MSAGQHAGQRSVGSHYIAALQICDPVPILKQRENIVCAVMKTTLMSSGRAVNLVSGTLLFLSVSSVLRSLIVCLTTAESSDGTDRAVHVVKQSNILGVSSNSFFSEGQVCPQKVVGQAN